MQTTIKNKITTDRYLLFIIIITAATLRFWNYSEIPFMHDELSALERTGYTNFHDEVVYGVAIYDTHPAGVQLFIYYWTKLFGMSEIIVKLPFIIFGLLSILIAYKISKKWFNSSVGLIVAAFMATIQYMVMYSQIARPYISGMFFSLVMVWCWSNYLFDSDKNNKLKWLIGYVFSAALCAYNHHFALLFAAITGVTGILFVDKTNWKAYFLAGAAIFILYIPHLTIFFFQLSKGGLGGPDGWLGKPDEHWFTGYLNYLFHYSYWMLGLLILLLVLSIIRCSNEIKTKQKFRIIALFWFLAVFFIEYYYSIKVSPVIQYSTLIFVFPFFLIFLFSLFGELSNTLKIVIVASVLITGTLTLILTREHFQVFYKQPYQEQVLSTFRNLDKIKDEKNATIELMIPPYYREYYFKKYNRRFNSIYYNSFTQKPDPKAFRSFVQQLETNYFIAGNLPLEYLQIIKEKYPELINKEEGFTYSVSCFSRAKGQTQILEQTIFTKKFDLSNGKNKIDSAIEFPPAYILKLKEITNTRHAIINLSARLNVSDNSANPLLVMDIQEKGKSIKWYGSAYFSYNNNPVVLDTLLPYISFSIGGSGPNDLSRKTYIVTPNTIYLSADLTSFNFKEHPDAEVKIYIWNKDKKEVIIDAFSMEVIKGNPIIYGLYEPIDK